MTYREKIISIIEAHKDEIIAIGEEIRQTPETGYFEEGTSSLVRSTFERLQIEYTYPHARTGVKAKIGKGSPNIAIIGELDSVKCENQNAHLCGHNAQIAAMLGAAIALQQSGVMDTLGGSVTFMAVPAEEFIELERRESLKAEGKINYFGGKQQLISEGAFDDIDMAIMLHAKPNEESAKVYVNGHNLGFLAKSITIRGRASHAGEPWEGTNALNAASLAILGVHSNRETFRDEEHIRIHPIITKGGDVVNSVPDEVCIETYVRGATLEAIQKGNAAVERAVSGACQIIGASYETITTPGYLPLIEDKALTEVFREVAEALLGHDAIVSGEAITGSTDMGDLSRLIPVIQPSIGGFSGNLHAKDFHIANKDTAYILSAKLLALTALSLLENDGERAKNVISSFHPSMDKESYIKYLKGEETNAVD